MYTEWCCDRSLTTRTSLDLYAAVRCEPTSCTYIRGNRPVSLSMNTDINMVKEDTVIDQDCQADSCLPTESIRLYHLLGINTQVPRGFCSVACCTTILFLRVVNDGT